MVSLLISKCSVGCFEQTVADVRPQARSTSFDSPVAVRAHLAPGGRFVFDAWLPDPALLRETSLESARFVHPDSGEAVTLREEFSYDAYAQVLSVRLTVTPVLRPEAREVLTLTQRQLFPEETLALLRAHGFDVRWRTSAFRPPPAEGARGDHLEAPDRRGALLAYVCTAR